MHREDLIVGLRTQERVIWHGELRANQQRLNTAQQEEDEGGIHVQ